MQAVQKQKETTAVATTATSFLTSSAKMITIFGFGFLLAHNSRPCKKKQKKTSTEELGILGMMKCNSSFVLS